MRAPCRTLGSPAHFPGDTQAADTTICTARAFKAAVKAGLLPADYQQGNDPSEYGETAFEGP